MNPNILTENIIPIIQAACLVIGYCLKNTQHFKDEYIPTTVTLAGAILACLNAHTFTLELLIQGAITGLSSTGLHEAFTQLLKNQNS